MKRPQKSSLGTQFFVEVLFVVAVSAVVPILWRYAIFAPAVKHYTAQVDRLLDQLLVKPPAAKMTGHMLLPQFEYQWPADGQTVSVRVAPGIGGVNGPGTFEVEIEATTIPINLVKDQRALQVLASAPQGTTTWQKFSQEPDDLNTIAVHLWQGSQGIAWQFPHVRLPFGIPEALRQYDDRINWLFSVPLPGAASGILTPLFIGIDTPYPVAVVFYLAIPIALVACLVYAISVYLFHADTLSRVNWVFIPALIVVPYVAVGVNMAMVIFGCTFFGACP